MISRAQAESDAKPHAIMVLGMHRSGTSALTRVLGLLGADLPKNLMKSTPSNPTGHWESNDLTAIHDALLVAAGSRWDDWRALSSDWLHSAAARPFKNQILEVLRNDFANSQLFAIKDPRICRFWPLWRDVLAEFGANPLIVIPVRNPLEVAASAKQQYDVIDAKTFLLWLRHVLDAESATRGLPRAVTTYDGLLEDWRGVMAKVAAGLGLVWPQGGPATEMEVERFLSKQLKRHSASSEHLPGKASEHLVGGEEVEEWLREAYAILTNMAAGSEHEASLARLDRIRAAFDAAAAAFVAALAPGEMQLDQSRTNVSQLSRNPVAFCQSDQRGERARGEGMVRPREALDATKFEVEHGVDGRDSALPQPAEADEHVSQEEQRPGGDRSEARMKLSKRAILWLLRRTGYAIIKDPDREQFDNKAAALATLEVRLAQAEAMIGVRNEELDRLRSELDRRRHEVAEARMETRRAVDPLERELEQVRTQVWRLQQRATDERDSAKRPTGESGPSLFYIAHFPHHHDRLYGENLHEFFAETGIDAATILLGDPADGQRPQLAECLSGDALGVIGFNSQLDHSYIGSTPFLQAAEEHRVPVIQWTLDHPSSRLAEFGNSSATNSRFLFSAASAEQYFRRFGLPNALAATVACVGPSRHSRAKNLNRRDFGDRPIAGMVAMNLSRIGGTIDDAWTRIRALEPRLRQAVEDTIERSYLDVIEPLEAHFETALACGGQDIADMDRHACMQMVEEIVQIRRRQKIFEVARQFPLLIQSDPASRPFQAGATACFKENQDVAVTWARLKLSRAQVSISNMHDMVHDRILNGLNAGCVNIVEDSAANRRVFQHGRDALFFRYGDDSLRECLELVFGDVDRNYEIAAAGFARRDDAPFRFGDFSNIIDLARRPFPLATDRS